MLYDLGVLIGLVYIGILPFVLGVMIIWALIRWYKNTHREIETLTFPRKEKHDGV